MKLEDKIKQLDNNQLERFESWLNTSQYNEGTSIIPSRENKEIAPLSHAQERLWFANYSAGESPVYNLSLTLNFKELSVPILKRCIYEVIRRHETLRTTFKIKNGDLVQVISAHVHAKVAIRDLRNLAPNDKQLKMNSFLSNENGLAIDLTKGPLFKTQVIQLDDNQYLFHCVIHHIISDGWSLNVLANEITTLYDAYVNFQQSPLPSIKLQYADFSEWQRNGSRDELNQKQLNYWKKTLKGAPQLLTLPCANERPEIPVFEGETQFFHISESLVQSFRDYCRSHDGTLFSGLMTVFKILLYKYSGEQDLVIGTPVANRVMVDLEPLIGFFVNTLLIRTKIRKNDDFTKLFRRVLASTSEAQDNQDIPFEQLVDELTKGRSLSYNPLFQIMFTLEKTMKDGYVGGLSELSKQINKQGNNDRSFVLDSISKGTSKFDMTFMINESGNNLIGACEYNKAIFSTEVISQFLEHFVNLLQSVAENPKVLLSELALYSEKELVFLEESVSRNQADSAGVPLAHHFERQEIELPELSANSRVYIVDQDENILPINVKGELWVRERNNNGQWSFIPTNLEALALKGGNIEVLGSVGRIVKINGRFVNLDRLQDLLQQLDGLDALKVTHKKNSIILSVLSAKKQSLVNQQILDELREKYNWLSDYLRISFSNPQTNKKKGERAFENLPTPKKLIASEQNGKSPESFIEKTLAGIWCEIVDVKKVSLDENFFDIGGSSMSAFQLLNRVKNTFNIELEVNKVFLFPTLRAFAQCVEDHSASQLESNEEVEVTNTKDPWEEEFVMEGFPLSYGQEQLWYLYKLNPDSPLYNVPCIITWTSRVDGVIMKTVVAKLMERHHSLRTIFSTRSGRPEQIISEKPLYEFEEIRMEEISENPETWGSEAQRLMSEASMRSFNLEKGPSLQVILFHFGDRDSWLYMNMHHIISDGKSHDVMIEEIKYLYAVLSEGKSIDLPDPPVQYTDFARDQRKRLTGKTKELLLNFWKNELKGIPPLLQLPYKGFRPEKQTFNGKLCAIAFTANQHKQIKEFGKQNGTTVFMTLLTAFNVLLQAYSKQDDIVIGVPVSNRYKSDYESIIGYFVNTTVFRNKLDPSWKLKKLLEEVKDSALRSMANKDLPFELLLGEVETERSQSFSPIFQVLFSHQESGGSAEDENFAEANQQVLEENARDEENPFQSGTSKFDLSLSFGETANQLMGSFEFSTDLFDEELIRLMVIDYKHILMEIIEQPDKCISDLVLLGVPKDFFPENDTSTINGIRLNRTKMISELVSKVEIADAHLMPSSDGGKRLLGYLVLNEAEEKDKIISSLKWSDYIMPASWLVLDSIPRDQNGNCIENELPKIQLSVKDVEVEFEAPKTSTQKNLALVWSHILNVPRVGIHDNFFNLGGSSLPAIHIALKIKELYGVDIPVDEIFDYPTIKIMAEYLDSVVRGEVKITSVFKNVPALVKIPRNGALPLSFAQERLWFLDQLEPNTAFYNVMSSCTFYETLDKEILEEALRTLIDRHESLRTTFAFEDGRAVQIIHDVQKVALIVEDLRTISGQNARNQRLTEISQMEFQEPFDLEIGPIFRYKAIQTSDNEFFILFTMHHIISDAWSATILEDEIKECYLNLKEGRPIKLPELSIQYVDFSVWQRRWMKGATLDNLVAFWRENLKNAPALLELPFSKRRSQFQSFKGSAVQMEVSGEVVEQLRELSKRNGVTLFTTTLSAFQALLHRYTGSSDIIVGTPSANRDKKGIENLIGFFTNTLVIRSKVEAGMTFKEFLGDVKKNWKSIQKHKDLPFEKMVEILQPSRSVSYNPIFQIMFSFLKADSDNNERSATESDTIVDLEHGISKFDMTLNVIENEHSFSIITEYNTDLFERDMMKRMLHHFANFLRSIGKDETLKISTVPLLPKEEKLLLSSFEIGEKIDYKEYCLHEYFEMLADENTSEIAVVYGDEDISYQKLEVLANQAANQLIELGVRPETKVAVCYSPSIELSILTLAVLKSGAVIVPLDKKYPASRLLYMLEDSTAEILLTDRETAGQFSAWEGTTIVIDKSWREKLEQYSDKRPRSGVTPENHLYILYTSGSTGKPKGAILKHKCVSNLIQWQIAETKGEKLDTLQFSPTSFDVSFQEIFVTWATGARLIMIDNESKGYPTKILEVINKFSVQRLFLPFVALDQIANESASSGVVPWSLKQIVTAGEQLRITPQVKKLFENLQDCTLENQYGPVETHIVTSYVLDSRIDNWAALPPIGKTLPNLLLYVVDEECQRVPIGIPGELMIGGLQIASEYLNQPEKTSERFIQNPFDVGRMYKSGDKVRFLEDGNIEFIGRLDNQVKIRGFRVEPGEIESVLVKHKTVQEVVVVFHGDSSSDRKLVCYYRSDEKVENDASEFSSYLSERLPEYMVPNFYIHLEELPKTPSGKIDRLKLTNLELPDFHGKDDFKLPQTKLEQRMAVLWERALGVKNIGLGDNFFELGGHSLLATKLIGGISDEFHVRVPVRSIFQSNTMEQLIVSVVFQKAQESDKYDDSLNFINEMITEQKNIITKK